MRLAIEKELKGTALDDNVNGRKAGGAECVYMCAIEIVLLAGVIDAISFPGS